MYRWKINDGYFFATDEFTENNIGDQYKIVMRRMDGDNLVCVWI